MSDYFDELETKLNLIATLDDYCFEISIKNGNIPSKYLLMTNEEFYYIYENGSPFRNIMPKNLGTSFYWWFKEYIQPRLSEECSNGILNNNWKSIDILNCFNSYIPTIKNWLKTKILEDQGKLQINSNEGGEIISETLDMQKIYDMFEIKVSVGETIYN